MKMELEDLSGGVTRIMLEGDLDAQGTNEIDLQFQAVASSRPKVVVDLAPGRFPGLNRDSHPDHGRQSQRPQGGKLVLVNPGEMVQKVLTSCGADNVLAIEDRSTAPSPACLSLCSLSLGQGGGKPDHPRERSRRIGAGEYVVGRMGGRRRHAAQPGFCAEALPRGSLRQCRDAWAGTKDDEVQVGLARDEAAAILTLVDGGRPFDPLQAAAPTLATDLEQAEIGGNGLTLIRSFADHVAYRREQDRNHLEFRFRLSRDSAAPDR